MIYTISDLKELPEITEYLKGQTKTGNLVPTAKPKIGSGAFGDVFIHRNNPALVVKKTTNSQIRDFEIASQLDHPNIVKVHQLFIKTYPFGKKKYKLVMDKIQGQHLAKFFGANLPPKTILSLMNQAKNCCLYLCDKGIHWGDMHEENTYFDPKTGKLTVADFGFWSQNQTPAKMAAINVSEAKRLLSNILETNNLGWWQIQDITFSYGKNEEADFQGKTSQEIYKIIEGYFDEAIAKFAQTVSISSSMG